MKIESILKPVLFTVSAITLSTAFVACEEKGPMEEAGERIDETVEEVTEN